MDPVVPQGSKRRREDVAAGIGEPVWRKSHWITQDKNYWTVPGSNYIGPNDPIEMDVEPVNRFDALAKEHDEIYAFIQDRQKKGMPLKEVLRLEKEADNYTVEKAKRLAAFTPTQVLHKAALTYGLGVAKPLGEYLGLISPGQYISTPERTPGRPRSTPGLRRSFDDLDMPVRSEPGRAVRRRLFPPVTGKDIARPPLSFRKRIRWSRRYRRKF